MGYSNNAEIIENNGGINQPTNTINSDQIEQELRELSLKIEKSIKEYEKIINNDEDHFNKTRNNVSELINTLQNEIARIKEGNIDPLVLSNIPGFGTISGKYLQEINNIINSNKDDAEIMEIISSSKTNESNQSGYNNINEETNTTNTKKTKIYTQKTDVIKNENEDIVNENNNMIKVISHKENAGEITIQKDIEGGEQTINSQISTENGVSIGLGKTQNNVDLNINQKQNSVNINVDENQNNVNLNINQNNIQINTNPNGQTISVGTTIPTGKTNSISGNIKYQQNGEGKEIGVGTVIQNGKSKTKLSGNMGSNNNGFNIEQEGEDYSAGIKYNEYDNNPNMTIQGNINGIGNITYKNNNGQSSLNGSININETNSIKGYTNETGSGINIEGQNDEIIYNFGIKNEKDPISNTTHNRFNVEAGVGGSATVNMDIRDQDSFNVGTSLNIGNFAGQLGFGNNESTGYYITTQGRLTIDTHNININIKYDKTNGINLTTGGNLNFEGRTMEYLGGYNNTNGITGRIGGKTTIDKNTVFTYGGIYDGSNLIGNLGVTKNGKDWAFQLGLEIGESKVMANFTCTM